MSIKVFCAHAAAINTEVFDNLAASRGEPKETILGKLAPLHAMVRDLSLEINLC